MTTTYSDFQGASRSEKVILCHIEPAERLLIWTLDSGAIYKRTTDYFVIDIKDATTSLTEASSAALNAGEWFYDIESGVCYIRMSDNSNPNTKNIVGYYRQFFSSGPFDLPYDLNTGAVVPYLPYLKSNSAVTKQLDEEQTGVALESATKVTLDNTSAQFDDSFDTLFYENKNIRIYSWSPSIAVTEAQVLFVGEIQDKTFSPSKIDFNCKDYIYRLREFVNLDVFTVADGDVPDSLIDTPKRRIYGQVDGVKCAPIDNTLDGYTLTGTVSSASGTNIFTGVGTSFLDELSPGDTLIVELALETVSVSIEEVTSDTSIIVNEEVESGFSGETAIINPDRPWRKKNRNWHIAGHKLRQPTTTIASASQPNRIVLTDGADFFAGDLIDVDGFDVNIKRISGNNVTLRQNIPSGTPSGGETVTRNPISKAFLNKTEAFINSDWTVTNTTEGILNLNVLAEFNRAPRRTMPGTITFTNASRNVTATGVNLIDYLKPRDWLQSDDLAHTTWYEILSVEENDLTLRVAYAGSTQSSSAYRKNPDLIGDDSLITVNCIGYESAGTWVKTASDAVKHLLENDSAATNINAASFTEADSDAPFTISMVIPETLGKDAPTIKQVVTKLNASVFGSLVSNSDFQMVYKILTPEKPEELEALEQHDIIGEPTVRSRNEIIRKVILKYRPFVDRFTGEDSFKAIINESDFVDNYIGSRQELAVTVYLYAANDALEIAERYALYNSLSQSTITIKGKLNLATKSLNDKVWINLDRIYKRFGGRDRQKIGIVNKIKLDGNSTVLEFNDLSNVFNRVPSITPDSANDFTSATASEKIKNGYMVDNDLEVPDVTSDAELGTNIIG